MRIKGMQCGRIRNELVGGLFAVILFSSLVTYATVLLLYRSNFDTLVRENDVETAKEIAQSLEEYYRVKGSWDRVEERISEQDSGLFSFPEGTRDREGAVKGHPKDGGVPLILTDLDGNLIYNGMRTGEGESVDPLPSRMKVSQGEPVTLNGDPVAYVFFKSMFFQSYNPQEKIFINSFTKSLGLSVFVGFLFALLLGTLLASRFVKPLISLDSAVQAIAEGEMSIQVDIDRSNEIGSLARSFNIMANKLQVTEEARQNLLADIAHELRTPVSIIQANLEMILEGVYPADENRLKSMFKETCILAGLISDLRSLSDMEVGIVKLQLEPVPIISLVNESCRKLLPLFNENDMRLDVSLSDEILVLAEEDKLRQVLRNILGNAVKYAPSGSCVKIFSSSTPPSEEHPGYVKLTIADEGKGVPIDSLERIFERFFRLDSSRSRHSGGRGLGLAISRTIIELSSGEMGAYNCDPHGLAIWFTLPMCRAQVG